MFFYGCSSTPLWPEKKPLFHIFQARHMVQVVNLAAYYVGHLSRSFLILYADGLVRSHSQDFQ